MRQAEACGRGPRVPDTGAVTTAGAQPSPAGRAAAADRRRRIGDFVIERELGRGGMGVVFEATQESLGRRVALKMLPSFAGMDPAAVARFRREAEAAGRLSHPGIVPVHSVGEHEGTWFFIMDLVEGPPLNQLVDALGVRHPDKLRASLVEEAELADRFPGMREADGGTGNAYVRSCARLVAEVANALAAAHRERIVHRDLKPSNILIHPSGRPVLVDFGLARDEQSLGLTKTGEQVGTPAYMSPEQASGRRKTDARVDVWGLGAVLYELLALRPPFEGGTAVEITRQILETEPVRVERRNGNVPVDLATIVHKCLCKDPDGRYAAIEALELDLRAFLAGRPILAQAPTRWARLQAGLQRRRRAIAIGCASAVAAAAVAVGAGVVSRRGDVQRGEQALAAASRALVELGQADAARDSYEQAIVLTRRPAAVKEQRLRDFRAAFAAHYAERPAVLERFVEVFDAAEREQLADLLGRLRGQGTLALIGLGRDEPRPVVAIRSLVDGELEPEWRTCDPAAAQPIGEHLVRTTIADGQVGHQWVRVVRDQAAEVWPLRLPGVLPDEVVVCLDARDRRWLAIGRCEVTRGEYRSWLAELPPEARQEMTPLGWDGGEADARLPVLGLSFHQARTFAVAHGAHLPSARELWLAGSGGLEGLRHPWGSRFDAARIAADPFAMTRPEPVDGRPTGVSPVGAHHVLGNAAEILSPVGEPAWLVGGGHYLADDPAALRLEPGAVPTAPLRSASWQDPNAGLRLCWFLPEARSATDIAELRERREELRRQPTGSLLHEWRIGAHGDVTCQVEMNGVHGGGEARIRVPLVTPGFLQLGGWRAADGHGTPVPSQWHPAPSGEHGEITADLPAGLRRGQGYRLVLTADLQPTGGLHPERDTYAIRIPLKRGGAVAAMHSILLPAGTAVVEAWPLPLVASLEEGLSLRWEPTPGDRVETAVVRFRVDGVLGRGALAWGAATAFATRFLTAWNGATDDLAAVLADDFRQLPDAVDRSTVLADPRRRLQLLRPEVQDVGVVGGVASVEFTADWRVQDRSGGELLLPAWPMVLQYRIGGSPRAIRLMPRAHADRGRYGADGYGHAGLRVRIGVIADTAVSRTQDAMTTMQLRLSTSALPQAFAQVVGHFADADEGAAAVRFRLEGGGGMLRTGRPLGEARVSADGWMVQDWLFDLGPGLVAAEQWWSLSRGRRHLLARFVVGGAGEAEARQALAAAPVQEWLRAVIAAIALD